MAAIPLFSNVHLERICDILADTTTGLAGSEMGRLLHDLGVVDPMPGMTMRHQLYEALRGRQQQDRCGNLVEFIHRAMDPVRYTGSSGHFGTKRHELNQVLAFCGLQMGEEGKLRQQSAARTLTEAEERAGRLRAELQRRGVHGDVLAFCRSELLQKNYFHAVFEATKERSGQDQVENRGDR
jgi:hypothetical protein